MRPSDLALGLIDSLEGGDSEELLALEDISVEASEDLPRIVGPLADDAAAAALGRAGALDQKPLDRDLMLAAIEAAAPALAKLRVHTRVSVSCCLQGSHL